MAAERHTTPSRAARPQKVPGEASRWNVIVFGVGALALGVLLQACGGASSPRDGTVDHRKGYDDGHVPATVEEAEQLLHDAEQQLSWVRSPQDDPPPPSPTALPDDGPEQAPAAAASNRCTRACDALRSMKRAGDRLCELTGDDDERCRRAKRRIDDIAERVREACPSCNA